MKAPRISKAERLRRQRISRQLKGMDDDTIQFFANKESVLKDKWGIFFAQALIREHERRLKERRKIPKWMGG